MADTDRLPFNARRAFRGFNSGQMALEVMARMYNPDWRARYFDFMGDALTAEWGAAKTNGTGATVTVAGGKLVLTSGTDSEGYAGQGFGLFWKGDNGIYMESEQQLDVLATSKIEMGLTDSLADAGAVNVKATPSATATDFAVLVRDADDNTDLDLISQDTTTVAARAETILPAVVAATDFTMVARAQGDIATFAVGSGAGNLLTVGSGAMQGGSLVTPWWFAQSRTTAARVLSVNYGFIIGPAS